MRGKPWKKREIKEKEKGKEKDNQSYIKLLF